jgi:hypothetical protein
MYIYIGEGIASFAELSFRVRQSDADAGLTTKVDKKTIIRLIEKLQEEGKVIFIYM